jgi:hypothetical protein
MTVNVSAAKHNVSRFMRETIIVAGAIANKLHNGGEAWVRLSWAMGLRKLGFDVHLIEQIAAENCSDAGIKYFNDVARQFGFAGRAALVIGGDVDVSLHDVANAAALLVNISGHLTIDSLLRRIRRRAYIDIDPGFTQLWHADPNTNFHIAGHDFYYTIGENIGTAKCPIPVDLHWRHVRQPVVLEDWPVVRSQNPRRFTTVASWRGPFGALEFNGKRLGLKLHEFRKIISLPRLCPEVEFELALSIHPNDSNDKAALEENGWRLIDPQSVAADPMAFQDYVQNSAAEFSVAQGVYVDTNSGWFSDRTVRYLASGKPVIVQQTGFSEHLNVGCGLLAFRDVEQAAEACRQVANDYESHAQAARATAQAYFDSDKVLSRFLAEMSIG